MCLHPLVEGSGEGALRRLGVRALISGLQQGEVTEAEAEPLRLRASRMRPFIRAHVHSFPRAARRRRSSGPAPGRGGAARAIARRPHRPPDWCASRVTAAGSTRYAAGGPASPAPPLFGHQHAPTGRTCRTTGTHAASAAPPPFSPLLLSDLAICGRICTTTGSSVPAYTAW